MKGSTNQNTLTDPGEKQPLDRKQTTTRRAETTTRHSHQQIPRGIHTAGWRGPWAALPSLGESPQGTVVPRGRTTPPPREPPPVAQYLHNMPDKLHKPQEVGPALSRSLEADMTAKMDCKQERITTQRIHNQPRRRRKPQYTPQHL